MKFKGVREISSRLHGRLLTHSEVIGHKVDYDLPIPVPYLSYLSRYSGSTSTSTLDIGSLVSGNSHSGKGLHDTRS